MLERALRLPIVRSHYGRHVLVRKHTMLERALRLEGLEVEGFFQLVVRKHTMLERALRRLFNYHAGGRTSKRQKAYNAREGIETQVLGLFRPFPQGALVRKHTMLERALRLKDQ